MTPETLAVAYGLGAALTAFVAGAVSDDDEHTMEIGFACLFWPLLLGVGLVIGCLSAPAWLGHKARRLLP